MKAILEKLTHLFAKENTSVSDGMNQGQREAIIDLLILCVYADHKIEFNEDRILDHEIERFKWHSELSIEAYLQASKTRTLEIIQTEKKRASHLTDISNRLKDDELKFRALKLCKLLFYSDWVMAEEEETFLKEIRNAFEIKR